MRRLVSLEPADPTRMPRWIRRARAALRQVGPLHQLVVRSRHRGISAHDAVLVAYPKSGSTWLAGMLAHLATGRELSFDDHDELTPPVGAHRRARAILPNGGRLIRSHEPSVPRLTGRYPRVVYMGRDGRDVAVSYYHDFRRKGVLDRSFAEFFDEFLSGSLDTWGTWSTHVQSWLDSPQAGTGALIVVRYEDLLEHPEAELSRVAAFLGLVVDAGQVATTVALHTAERMRQREQDWRRANAREVAPGVLFVRRASPGESQEVLSPHQQATFETLAGVATARLGYAVPRASPATRVDPGRSCRAH